mgnify:CR=1 FL=1
MKTLLKQEEEAHAKCVDKILDLEAQLEQFTRTSAQLVESKRKCTDLDMQVCDAINLIVIVFTLLQYKVRELSHRLRSADELVAQLRDSNVSLQGTDVERKNIASTLEAQLHFAHQEMQAMASGVCGSSPFGIQRKKPCSTRRSYWRWCQRVKSGVNGRSYSLAPGK